MNIGFCPEGAPCVGVNAPSRDPCVTEGIGVVLSSLGAQVAATQAVQSTVSSHHAPLLVAANYLLKCVAESQVPPDRLPGESGPVPSLIHPCLSPGLSPALPNGGDETDAGQGVAKPSSGADPSTSIPPGANNDVNVEAVLEASPAPNDTPPALHDDAHHHEPHHFKVLNKLHPHSKPALHRPALTQQKSIMDKPGMEDHMVKQFHKFLDVKNHPGQNDFLIDPERLKANIQKDKERDLDYHHYTVSFKAFTNSHVPNCGNKSVIYPDSSFRIYWDLLAMALICMAFFTVPMELSFNVDLREYHEGAGYFFTFVDIFFLADMVLSFNTAFYQDGLLVPTRGAIFWNYLTGWFIVDLVSSFPYTWILQLTYGGDIPGSQGPKLLRMLRIGKFMRLFKVLRALKLGQYSQSVFDVLPNQMINFITFVRLVLKMLVFCHLLACLWHWVGGLSEEEDTWIFARGLETAEIRERYICSVYYALTTATTVGYGDVTPQNIWEELMASFVMVVSVGIFSSLMGNITAITVDSHSEFMHVQKKVRSATQFMKRMGISAQLRRRVQRYVKHVCEVQVRAETDDDVLGIIGGPLQDELIANVIKHALKTSAIFRHASTDLVDTCSLSAVCARFEPGNFAIVEGMEANGLWILVSGRCQLVRGDASEPLTTPGGVLNPGTSFGEWSLLTDAVLRPYPCGAQCVQHCDFVHIWRDEFLKISQDFPEADSALQRVATSTEPWGTGMPCALCLEIGHCALDCGKAPASIKRGNSQLVQGQDAAFKSSRDREQGLEHLIHALSIRPSGESHA